MAGPLKHEAEFGRIPCMIYLLSGAVLARELGAPPLPGIVLVDLRGSGAVEAMMGLMDETAEFTRNNSFSSISYLDK